MMDIDVYTMPDGTGTVLSFGDQFEALLTRECAERLIESIQESLADAALLRQAAAGEA